MTIFKMDMVYTIGTPGGQEMFVIVLILLGPYLVNILAKIDILRHEFQPHQNKLVWLIVTLFLPLIGGVLSFLIGRKNRLTKEIT